MKLTLTIEGDASTLALVLANLPKGAIAATMMQPTIDDDDDSGEADPNAPATDADGLPWDGRIHSSNRKLKADGTWVRKRGVDKSVIDLVEAELRGHPPQPVPMTPVAMPPAVPAEPAPPPQPLPIPQPMPPVAAPAPVAAAPQPQPMPPQPVAAAPQPQPVAAAPQPQPVAAAAPAADAPMGFGAFMNHIMGQTQKRDAAGEPLLSFDYLISLVGEISTAYQLPQPLTAITDLQNREDLIPYAIQLLQRDGKW